MKRVLLFGGGGVHDYRSICPILQDYAKTLDEVEVDYVAEDYTVLHQDRIAPYDAIVMYHTGGELQPEAKHGLVEAVAAGKGFVGVHSAADSFKNAPEYLAMIGGCLIGHPAQRDYIVALADIEHPVTSTMQGYTVKDWEDWPIFEYQVHDEQYLLDFDPRVNVLAKTIYSGTLPKSFAKADLWPVAWTKDWGKGRVFYLALGHNPQACRNSFFIHFFRNGLSWALR